MSKELVTKEETAIVQKEVSLDLSQIQDPELMAMMSEDAKTYVDDTSADDLAIPRIRIIQSGSKQIKKADPNRIEGAEEGDFLNSATNEVVKGEIGIYFVPVKRRIVYLEWKDLAKGGGLVNNFGEDASAYNAIIPDENGARKTNPDAEIVKTYEIYGYQVDITNKKYNQVILSLAKSQVKKMKKWNTIIRTLVDRAGQQLPEYAGIYKLTTIPESNDKGSWFNFEIILAGYTLAIPEIGKIVYEKSKEFANFIKNSKVQAHYADEEIAEQTTQTELI